MTDRQQLLKTLQGEENKFRICIFLAAMMLTKKTTTAENVQRKILFPAATYWPLLQLRSARQGCQMTNFQAKNTNLGKFWRVLQRKLLEYIMAIWSIVGPFGIFCGHLVYCRAIWHILRPFGIFYDNLVYFPPFWYVYTKKYLATLTCTTAEKLFGVQK
jgi:hypothetical protein